MQIALNQLQHTINQGLNALYILHGDEPLLEQEALEQIRTVARHQGFSERSVFVAAAKQFDWSSVLAAGASQSLFSDKQIIELRLPSGKPGVEGAQVLTKIAAQAKSSASEPDILFIIILPKVDKTMRNAPWFKALQQEGMCIPIHSVLRKDMPVWLAQRLKKQGQRVSAGEQGSHTLEFVSNCVEGNLLAAHQEIQKLALLYPPGELTYAQVEACIYDVARYNIQTLSEAALSGQLWRAQRILSGLLAEGFAFVPLLSVLAGDVLSLYRAKQALDEGVPMPQALRQAGAWGSKERLFEQLLNYQTLPVLGQVLRNAQIVDGCIKGLKNSDWPVDAEACLQRLIIQICNLNSPNQKKSRLRTN